MGLSTLFHPLGGEVSAVGYNASPEARLSRECLLRRFDCGTLLWPTSLLALWLDCGLDSDSIELELSTRPRLPDTRAMMYLRIILEMIMCMMLLTST